jgi:dihydrofolate reductase
MLQRCCNVRYVGFVRFQVAVSIDGYLAGPDQSLENPLGVGGEELHRWLFELDVWRSMEGQEGGVRNASSAVMEEAQGNIGAYVMGRNMFGGGRGPWRDDLPWTGWWGEDPPYHAPVFVLTHDPREPVEMQGGTTFHFVTDGLDAAFDRAEEAAGGKDILIAGGANVIRQSLAAGRVDGFWLHLAPIVLGAGERPLDDVGTLRLEQVRAVDAPGVTHIEYRVLR